MARTPARPDGATLETARLAGRFSLLRRLRPTGVKFPGERITWRQLQDDPAAIARDLGRLLEDYARFALRG